MADMGMADLLRGLQDAVESIPQRMRDALADALHYISAPAEDGSSVPPPAPGLPATPPRSPAAGPAPAFPRSPIGGLTRPPIASGGTRLGLPGLRYRGSDRPPARLWPARLRGRATGAGLRHSA